MEATSKLGCVWLNAVCEDGDNGERRQVHPQYHSCFDAEWGGKVSLAGSSHPFSLSRASFRYRRLPSGTDHFSPTATQQDGAFDIEGNSPAVESIFGGPLYMVDYQHVHGPLRRHQF